MPPGALAKRDVHEIRLCNIEVWSSPQKHLRWMTEEPDSSNSALVIHIVWKVDRVAWIEPPSQAEYLRSGFSMIFVL